MAPAGSTTRPTSDRVKEATFNALGSLGAVVDQTVLDLFAGSGSLGIEALSRGAAHATFVDADRAALAAIDVNLTTTNLHERATVAAGPADRFLRSAGDRRWDLALLDPPYDHSQDDWLDLLDRLPSDLAVLESRGPVEPPFGWEVLRTKRYGTTHVTIVERRPV